MSSHTGPASIVCFSNLDWGYLKYRKQHLMERLAPFHPVVYVNPPRAVKARAPRQWHRVSTPAPGVLVYEPPVFPGVRHSRAIKHANDRVIAAALNRLPALRGERIAWVYSPHALGILDRIRPSLVVYDIADDYTAPSGARLRDAHERVELARMEALEARMLERADVVFAVSEPLAERAARRHRAVTLVPNGCDIAATAAGRAPARGPRPRIGYVGTVAPRVDLQLLWDVAAARPQWDIEIAGPVSPLVTLPPALPNLHWRGEIPYRDVAATIASFDAAILPLLDIPFSYCSSPIQVYDYLAAGKPVVASPVAQLERMPALVTTARGRDAFVSAIEAALAGDSARAVEERKVFARRNSWDARVATILDVLGAHRSARAA
jgi:UDP-galactopyranose mutase